MYSTCLFCHQALGANETIEQFPVGRRLAFDPGRGRLWVVCKKCERWNLSPIEERWEAIEACERSFRDTRLRVSTENVGLARVKEGLELVRIGQPQRPEMAAWRYGDQFGRRRRNNYIKAGLGLGAVGAVIAGGVVSGVGIGGFGWYIAQLAQLVVKGSPNKILVRLPLPDGGNLPVRRRNLDDVRLTPARDGPWSLVVSVSPDADRVMMFQGGAGIRFDGAEALHAARSLLPHMNRYGGSAAQVQQAVRLLEETSAPDELYARVAHEVDKNGRRRDPRIAQMPDEMRLALEMAAHEEIERRAMEGELARLEQDWRDAEEIAAISDNLLVPSAVDDFLSKRRTE